MVLHRLIFLSNFINVVKQAVFRIYSGQSQILGILNTSTWIEMNKKKIQYNKIHKYLCTINLIDWARRSNYIDVACKRKYNQFNRNFFFCRLQQYVNMRKVLLDGIRYGPHQMFIASSCLSAQSDQIIFECMDWYGSKSTAHPYSINHFENISKYKTIWLLFAAADKKSR